MAERSAIAPQDSAPAADIRTDETAAIAGPPATPLPG